MIEYQKFELENGLRVFHIEDHSTPMVAFNLLYNVGSRDEHPDKTGFAHLFEHLMFGGTKNIPHYDEHVQMVGGENNAFTSPDITNYYITLPAVNLETAFWVEADRMNALDFSQKSLDVQRKVVIEEFNQRYLNQPYGDAWLKIRPLAYQTHPYRWATIGKEISHIENANIEDVESFFYRFYAPNNAVLAVAGAVNFDLVKKYAEKYFGCIARRNITKKSLPKEPKQTEARFGETSGKVPLDMIYKTFSMPGRFDDGFIEYNLIMDTLGQGKSSIFHQKLVRDMEVFNSLSLGAVGSLDPGLMVASGSVNPKYPIHEANKILDETIEEYRQSTLSDEQIQKTKNKLEAMWAFSEIEMINQALNVCTFANADAEDKINTEQTYVQSVQKETLQKLKLKAFDPTISCTFHYKKNGEA